MREPVPTACLLAGGRGRRLRSVVADRPKPLAEVAGRPFVTRLLDRLAAAGVRRAVLCTGYLADVVEATLGDAYGALELVHSAEPRPLGTAGALRRALPLVPSSTALVLNADSYCAVDLAAFLDAHRQSGAVASVAVAAVEDASACGRLRLDADGWVTSYEEKVAGAGPALVNAGLYLLERRAIEAVPAGRAVSLERDVLPALVGRGLRGFACGGRLLDIGTPASLARATAFFAGEPG